MAFRSYRLPFSEHRRSRPDTWLAPLSAQRRGQAQQLQEPLASGLGLLTTCLVGPQQSACAEGSQHDFNHHIQVTPCGGNCLAMLPFSARKLKQVLQPTLSQASPSPAGKARKPERAARVGGFGQQERGSSRWRHGVSSDQRAGSRNALGSWRLVCSGAKGAPGSKMGTGGRFKGSGL